MGDNQNWYRQLLALLLLSSARAAVEYLTNPKSRTEASKQLREAFQQIDYDAAAKALIHAIDDAAETSKEKLDSAIDALREAGVDAVDDAKVRAEKQAGKKSGGFMRWVFILGIAGAAAYFFLNEQRRDELLDRLTGASGPIEQATQSAAEQVTTNAQQSVNQATQQVDVASTPSAAEQAEQVAQEAAKKNQQ